MQSLMEISARPGSQGRVPFATLLLLLGTLLAGVPEAAIASDDGIRERLRNRIEAAGATSPLQVGDDRIHAAETLARFYQDRLYAPAWTRHDEPTPAIQALIETLRDADEEGLRPEDYHLSLIEKVVADIDGRRRAQQGPDPGDLVDLDLLLTDAFLLYGSHSLSGHLDPERIDSEWVANRRGADLAALLKTALAEGTVRETLGGLLPPQNGYARLKDALARYRTLARRGGWLPVPAGPTLHPGDAGARVAALRARLQASGDLRELDGGDLFDEAVDDAVRRYQARNGLETDGIVGRMTLAALNVRAEHRVRQIIVNLERWRWLPQEMGRRHVIVNIADFRLDVVDSDSLSLSMAVIVGQQYRRTPVFSALMTYLVLNPSWEVPPSIAVKDILPQIRKDPDYLSRMGIRVLKGWGGDERVIDPASVDWAGVRIAPFPYRFRQAPGTANALGRIKFMFPNRFNVYLHDTPARALFGKTVRAFSSGCIRVAEAVELAVLFLSEDPVWTRDAILAAIDSGKEQSVRLPRPVPVHLLYWTAWVDPDGTVQFREDIYGRDRLVDAELREPPPSVEFTGAGS